ncbi:MAG: hypothetical protein JW920_07220 [Deltaproteobacteria bacterium]|nr:hypothetical protein [Deltaproteobacteria bacterium]
MVLKGIDQNRWSLELKRVSSALARLGHPEKKYFHILVAGTNGKGSTCIYLERLLMGCGYSVGTTISPHLNRFTERFRFNGQEFAEQTLSELFHQIKPALDSLNLTYYEWCVVLASEMFARQNIDIAIFEIGLGGRLDAANVMDPVVSVITDISFDHTQYLGNTLAQIAGEKAAIARPGRPLVTTVRGETLDVLKAHASSIGAHLKVVSNPVLFATGISGSQQALNAALALETVRMLGMNPGRDNQVYAFNTAFLPGRLEKVGSRIVLDVAHNPASMIHTMEYLKQQGFKGVAVAGFLKDKDYQSMLKTLKEICFHIYIAPLRTQRSWGRNEMETCREINGIRLFSNIREAFDQALKDHENVVVTGSFYTVAEVRDTIIWHG